MASFRKWWDRYRHFRAGQGLAQDILAFFGWKKTLGASVTGILTFLRTVNLQPVEVWVLSLGAFAFALLIFNFTPPAFRSMMTMIRKKPIARLEFQEHHGGVEMNYPLQWRGGTPAWISIRNHQDAPAMRAVNVTARLEFIDSQSKVRLVTPQASWYEIQRPTPKSALSRWRNLVDIEGGEEQSFVLFVQSEKRQLQVFSDAAEPVGDLDYDHWTVKIVVASDNGVGFEGALGFMFTRNSLIWDAPKAFTRLRTIQPLVKP